MIKQSSNNEQLISKDQYKDLTCISVFTHCCIRAHTWVHTHYELFAQVLFDSVYECPPESDDGVCVNVYVMHL